MPIAVVPVLNESSTISLVLDQLQHLPLREIVLILNGCQDNSAEIIQRHQTKVSKKIILFAHPLGIDIPRAIGLKYALTKNAKAVLFVDGDLTASVEPVLYKLLQDVCYRNVDLALTNCYPYPDYRSPLAQEILYYRKTLNRTLGIFHQIGLASPSHGPHCVSRMLMNQIPINAFAIPPLELAFCVEMQGLIKVSAALNDITWHAKERDIAHNIAIAETIIGDCFMAQNYFLHAAPNRKGFYGYHQMRRFDLLEKTLF